jgi:hypothetical protein
MSVDPDKVYSSDNLQDLNDDFLSARLGELFPDGPPAPPAPSPSSDSTRDSQLPAVEYARRTREIHDEMMKTNMGSPQMAELQAELDALLQERHPETSSDDPAMTREAWRPDLPPGITWDPAVAGPLEDAAPGAPMLMHVVADTLRSSARRLDVGESWSALAQQHGEDEADALLRDADAYARAYLPTRTYADLKERKLISPELIYRAAMFWRQRDGRG